MPYRSPLRQFLLAIPLLMLAGIVSTSRAAEEEHSHHGHGGDLLFFPAMQFIHLNRPVAGRPQDKLQPEVDIFYSADRERLRFLAEFLVRDDEQEMERMQLGWLFHPAATLWVGRFHSPLGFWNSEHHHGAFMQTTISRPSILAFEDESGVLPTHVLGALAEGSVDAARGDFNYALGFGRGPVLDEALEPLDVLGLRNRGKLALAGRLSYRDEDGRSEFGAFAGHARIPIAGRGGLDESRQWVAGAFYTVETERLRLLGELFRVDNRLDGPDISTRSAFTAAYLQPEYRMAPAWTVFGRLEATRNNHNNAYLNLFPEFVISRHIAGSRIAVGRNQALKFELSHNERQDRAHFNQISLQWSMVYP